MNYLTSAAIKEVAKEHGKAIAIYQPFHSAHEGYAVLLEEVRELEKEVFKRPGRRSRLLMRKEAIQVAAMALRFIVDVCEP